MRIKIEKKEALRLLDVATRGRAPTAHRYENCVMLQTADRNGARLWVSSQDTSGSCIVNTRPIEAVAGKALVDFKQFGLYLKAMPDGPVDLSLREDGARLLLRSDAPRCEFSQGTIPPEEFPKLADPPKDARRVKLPGAALVAIHRATEHVTARAGGAPWTYSVHVWGTDGRLHACAADGRSFRYFSVAAADVKAMDPIDLPASLLAGIAGDATIVVTPERVWAEQRDTLLGQAMRDGGAWAPHNAGVIDQMVGPQVWIRVPRAVCLDSLKAIMSVNDQKEVRMSASDGGPLVLRAVGADTEATLEIPADSSACWHIAASAERMARALASFDSDEVAIGCPAEGSDATVPIAICPAASADRSSAFATGNAEMVARMTGSGGSS